MATTKKKPAQAKAVKSVPPRKPAKKTPEPNKPIKSFSARAAAKPKLGTGALLAQMSSHAAGPALPPRLQAMLDKSEISDVLCTLARGIDRIDETLLRSVFHSDATIDLGPGVFQGAGADYVHWVLGVLSQVRESHHLIGNVRASLERDVAMVESYCHAHFRLDKPTGREDVFIGSRFLDRMERRPAGPAGVWKIVHRKQVIDWVRTEAVSDLFYHQNPDALWSYRTKTDPSYQMAQFPGSQQGSKLPAFLGRRYETKSIKF